MKEIFRKHFTRWYVKKGYGLMGIPGSPVFSFLCPNWVKFFANWLFSFDVYKDEIKKGSTQK